MRISSRTAALCLALFFTAATYTTNGCGGLSTAPETPDFGAEITGRVLDSASGAAIGRAGVTVIVGNTNFFTVAETDGRYRVAATPGPAILQATAAGYVNFSTQITVRSGGNSIDIRMQRAP